VWEDGFRAAERREIVSFVAEHGAVFDQNQERYAGVMDEIVADDGFSTYLSQVLAPAQVAARETRDGGAEHGG
jgi:hypothetical protein